MTNRNNPPAFRRTNRAHGVTKKDAELMRQFEYQKRQAPPVLDLKPVPVRVACPCSFRPYPHILHDEYARERHQRGEKA